MSDQRQMRILVVDDEEIVHLTLGDYLRDTGRCVDGARSGPAALESIAAHVYDLALVDVRMPGMDGLSLLAETKALRPEMPVVLMTGHADADTAIGARRLGAADFLTKPIKLAELDAVLEKARRGDRGRSAEAARGLPAAPRNDAKGVLVGYSAATRQVRRQIAEAVAAGCETILITGETGVGKEVVARELHAQASRPKDPFVAVCCASLPESLVESELFGHRKGAFTGAAEDRAGCFEQAHGGTLFLDEIGELSPAAQAKVLRVLETRALRRVGGSEEIAVGVRVIAATNVPLEERVKTGGFRRDLFYRLNVYAIHLLPLRQRRDDILPLAEHFLAAYALPRGLRFDGFSAEARCKLLRYDFPGNARELRNLVQRAAIACRSGTVLAEHIDLREADPLAGPPDGEEASDRDRVRKALEEARWNRREAAKRLGIPYSTLRYKVQKLGLAD